MAIGRIGDLINGEHYSHPEALTPTHDIAYTLGRLVIFTWRSDRPDAAVAGLSSSQLMSVMLLGVAAAGLTRGRLRRDAARTA